MSQNKRPFLSDYLSSQAASESPDVAPVNRGNIWLELLLCCVVGALVALMVFASVWLVGVVGAWPYLKICCGVAGILGFVATVYRLVSK